MVIESTWDGDSSEVEPAFAQSPRMVPQPMEAVDSGGEGIEEPGELRIVRRATSVTWWENSTAETWSDPETFTEYTLDSADTSVSSTRASTNATGEAGSLTRLGRRSTRGFSVVVRGERSPHGLFHGAAPPGYRGRSLTRRGGRTLGAAMRHRRPTHTPSRDGRADTPPNVRARSTAVLLATHRGVAAPRLGRFREIARVREEAAEAGS